MPAEPVPPPGKRGDDADERTRCQHCPNPADERSYMCEDCAGQADAEMQDLRDQLRGALGLICDLIPFASGWPFAGKAGGDQAKWHETLERAHATTERLS